MFFVCVSCFQDYRPDSFKNTESITNRADIDQKFYEIGKLPEDYADVKDFSKDHKFEEVFEKDLGLSKYRDELKNISVKTVNNLIDFLKLISK